MTELTSYCCECDAKPGDCTHTGNRYHDPITYQPTEFSWHVPDHEQTRWDNPKWLASTGHWTPPRQTIETEPLPLASVLQSLEGIIYVDDGVKTLIYDSYDNDPGKTTQIVTRLAHTAGHLSNPAGLLVKRLREIHP